MFQQTVLVDDVNHSKTWLWLKHIATKNAGREINTMWGIYKTPILLGSKRKLTALITLAHLYVLAMHRLCIAKVLVDTKIHG